MKFLCSNCKAKYQIADEKVAGRTLRMTCRRCKEEIVIHGGPEVTLPSLYPVGAGASPLPPPSPLGADFQMQVAAQGRAAPPIAPPIDEWHVGINDVPVGPMRREEVARKLAVGAIGPQSLAWREGLDDWLPIRNIPELAVLCGPPPGIGLPPPGVYAQPQAQYGGLPPVTIGEPPIVIADPGHVEKGPFILIIGAVRLFTSADAVSLVWISAAPHSADVKANLL
jgi:predicted Zn finger-like uncharacterized protein